MLSTKFPPQNLIMQLSNLINSRPHLEKYKTLTNKLVDDGIMTREETTQLVTTIEQKLQSPEWEEIRNWFEAQQGEETTTTTTTTSSSSTSERQNETTTPSLATSMILTTTSIRIIAIFAVIKNAL